MKIEEVVNWRENHIVQRGEIKVAHWYFYRGPTTGEIGMSKPLQKFLDECCKKYNGKIHYTIDD